MWVTHFLLQHACLHFHVLWLQHSLLFPGICSNFEGLLVIGWGTAPSHALAACFTESWTRISLYSFFRFTVCFAARVENHVSCASGEMILMSKLSFRACRFNYIITPFACSLWAWPNEIFIEVNEGYFISERCRTEILQFLHSSLWKAATKGINKRHPLRAATTDSQYGQRPMAVKMKPLSQADNLLCTRLRFQTAKELLEEWRYFRMFRKPFSDGISSPEVPRGSSNSFHFVTVLEITSHLLKAVTCRCPSTKPGSTQTWGFPRVGSAGVERPVAPRNNLIDVNNVHEINPYRGGSWNSFDS